jgi:chitin synthase
MEHNTTTNPATTGQDASGLARNQSTSSRLSRRTTTGNDGTTRTPRRQKSLVRPERERVDANHRQYHYRQRAGNRDQDMVAPSTTGNQPNRQTDNQQQRQQQEQEQDQQQGQQVRRAPSNRRLERKPTNRQNNGNNITTGGGTGGGLERRPTASRMIRRGKSILGREKPRRRPDHRSAVAGGGGDDEEDDGDYYDSEDGAAINYSRPPTLWEKMPSPWLSYCRLLTCCIPGAFLGVFGKYTRM